MRLLRKFALGAGLSILALAALDLLLPPDLQRAQEQSVVVADRDGRVLRVFPTGDGALRIGARLDEVDPHFVQALVAFEDKRFWHHPGVDPIALARAAAQWIRHGRIVSGGSTLTMQVARLLEPRAERGLVTKSVQILRALQLERRFDKRQVLELYLALAPYGSNLEGVRAASLAWFDTTPDRLTARQIATLVALPQSPTKLRPDRRGGARIEAASDKVLRRTAAAGIFTPAQLADARSEPVAARRYAFPQRAVHLAQFLARDQARGGWIRSTIDGELQAQTEALLAREADTFADGASVAAIIVDLETRDVRAYVGGRGLDTPQGHVDLARAARSPGSVLKPFVYAMGFDDRVIHPETLIEDRPTAIGGYAPRNFDGAFQGTVSIRTALQHSLNVPAIALLDRLGPERLAATLRGAGATLHFPTAMTAPSLPLVLGGVGISLTDVVGLYAHLADEGAIRPLRFRTDAPRPRAAEQRLVGARAAYEVAEILAGAPLPDGRAPDPLRWFAYKTGTSFGFRDAWAVGYDGTSLIGVWVGRAEGTPRPGALGRLTAAPILFKLRDLLPPAPIAPLVPPPDHLVASTNAALPLGLQKFQTVAGALRVESAPPAIVYPPNGAVVSLRRPGETAFPDLTLIASGGKRPLRWLVNGVPVDGDPSRLNVTWRPDGAGFVRLTVVDDLDRRATSLIRIQ